MKIEPKRVGGASHRCRVGPIACWKVRESCTRVTIFVLKDVQGPQQEKPSQFTCLALISLTNIKPIWLSKREVSNARKEGPVS